MLSSIYNLSRSNLIILLVALIVLFLPNLEAPKNVFFLGLILVWVLFSFKSRDFGGRWNHFDSIFLLFFLVNILVALNAHFEHNQPIKGANDIFRIIIFGWVVSRIRFSKRNFSVLVFCNALSVLTVAINLYSCPKLGECIMLNSVGHVNHTAIYLLISLSLTLPFLIEKYRVFSKTFNFFAVCYLFFISYMIIATNSRAAFGALVLIFLTIFIFYSLKGDLKKLYLFGSIALISIIISLISPPKVIDKFYHGTSIIGFSPRQTIRNFAYEVFKIDPILGTGMSNFPNFGLDDIKDNVINEKGIDWWQKKANETYLPYAHPHNLYYAYLSGGGIIFLVTMLLFWSNIIKEIIKDYKERKSWILLPVSLIVLVNLIVGFFNTTFENEHGLLSMLVLGIFLSQRRYGHT